MVDMDPILGTLDMRLDYTLNGTPVMVWQCTVHMHSNLQVIYRSQSSYQHVSGRLEETKEPGGTHLIRETMHRISTQAVTQAKDWSRDPGAAMSSHCITILSCHNNVNFSKKKKKVFTLNGKIYGEKNVYLCHQQRIKYLTIKQIFHGKG